MKLHPDKSAAVVARSSERPSLEDIYRDYRRTAHGIALAHVGPADADDVCQEAFMAIGRGLRTVRDLDALPAWVCTVVRNTARDHLRKRSRRPRLVAEKVAEPSRRPDDVEVLRRRVLEHIASFSEAYRETLILRLAEGLTGPEIAERTGLTPGSVRVNLCRGMAALREKLAEDGWP